MLKNKIHRLLIDKSKQISNISFTDEQIENAIPKAAEESKVLNTCQNNER